MVKCIKVAHAWILLSTNTQIESESFLGAQYYSFSSDLMAHHGTLPPSNGSNVVLAVCSSERRTRLPTWNRESSNHVKVMNFIENSLWSWACFIMREFS